MKPEVKGKNKTRDDETFHPLGTVREQEENGEKEFSENHTSLKLKPEGSIVRNKIRDRTRQLNALEIVIKQKQKTKRKENTKNKENRAPAETKSQFLVQFSAQ